MLGHTGPTSLRAISQEYSPTPILECEVPEKGNGSEMRTYCKQEFDLSPIPVPSSLCIKNVLVLPHCYSGECPHMSPGMQGSDSDGETMDAVLAGDGGGASL